MDAVTKVVWEIPAGRCAAALRSFNAPSYRRHGKCDIVPGFSGNRGPLEVVGASSIYESSRVAST